MELTAGQINTFYILSSLTLGRKTAAIAISLRKGIFKDLDKCLPPYHNVRQQLCVIKNYDPIATYNCLTYQEVFNIMQAISRELGMCINFNSLADTPIINHNNNC